jgi:hypothetical protein
MLTLPRMKFCDFIAMKKLGISFWQTAERYETGGKLVCQDHRLTGQESGTHCSNRKSYYARIS